MWSDAPNQVETRGAAQEDFDLERAAESLAQSDVSLADGEDGAHADGGCECGGNCACGRDSNEPEGQVASDGGYIADADGKTGTSSAKTKTEQAYELLHEEARRVYGVGESHYQSWGWEVYSYTWTKSIGAGVFLLPALFVLAGLVPPSETTVGIAAVASLVFIGLTTVLLIADLERPSRFHWVLLRPNWNSWLVKGGYILTVTSGFLTLVALGWLAGYQSLVIHPLTLAVGALLAAATAVYTAFLFSQSKGRDLWQSPVMPLHMFTQAVLAGGATTALMGLAGVPGFGDVVRPAVLSLGAGVAVHAVLIGSEIFTPHQTEDAEEAAARIVRGRFRTPFWVGGVLAGIVLPVVALAVGGSIGIAAAAVLSLAGLFAFEYCWITAPQTISLA
jgi:formate-dependent nitrite reductase membrane component NrfD